MPPYSLHWHELTDKEQEKVRKSGIRFNVFMLVYEQPPWCEHPEALTATGCFSLITGHVHSQQACKGCEFNKNLKED